MSDTQKLQRRNRELSILNSIAAALNREVDLRNALHTVMAQVADLLDLQTAWVWLMASESEEAYLAAAQNLPPALTDTPERMLGSCYCLDTYAEDDLDGAANVNVVKCSRLKNVLAGTEGLRYHASIPLYSQNRDKKLGILNVASADWRELAVDDLQLLYTIGDLLAMAIERAQLFACSAEFGMVQERNRLAREIHDTLAQGLAALTLQLETADALLENKAATERVQKVIQQALALTRHNLEEARRSVLDLRAAPLEGKTLSEALWSLAQSCAPVQVDFMATGVNRPLTVRIEVGLYRIAQEALANVLRHAGAQHVTLHLIFSPEQAQLICEDDGQGFDLATLRENRFGLIGLNERAKLLGGTCQIASTPGTGTRVEVTIPLE